MIRKVNNYNKTFLPKSHLVTYLDTYIIWIGNLILRKPQSSHPLVNIKSEPTNKASKTLVVRHLLKSKHFKWYAFAPLGGSIYWYLQANDDPWHERVNACPLIYFFYDNRCLNAWMQKESLYLLFLTVL